ncbi:MAG: adenylate/guanylate cyclase domain-containing protein [Rhodospirillales bacterium]
MTASGQGLKGQAESPAKAVAGIHAAARPWWRRWDAGTVRLTRLWSGLVLFTYVTTHLINHSLGLFSFATMNAALEWVAPVWRSYPGTAILWGALFIHGSLALWAIYQRRRLNLPLNEWVRLVLGLSIVPLMVQHVTVVRLGAALYGSNLEYGSVMMAMFVAEPWTIGARQTLGLVVAWMHGCIGLYLVWRLKPWWPRAVPYLYAAAILVPVLALLGVAEAGRDVVKLAAEPGWFQELAAKTRRPSAEQGAVFYTIEAGILWGYAALVAAAFLARMVRAGVERRRGLVRVRYPDGRAIEVPPGTSILDASRIGGVPHAQVCGGRGRCSTCRVRVGMGLEHLPAPSDAERKVLERIAAAPNVRLACQTRPAMDVSIMPLLPPTATARDGFAKPAHVQGQEREIAILFADLRMFTQLAEHKLPYDVVFLLNRYFAAMGTAVERAGGRVDKFIGDGVMALFGVDSDPAAGCRGALNAARAMAEQLAELNQAMMHELDNPLKIGIGIHAGPAIVGEMGYAAATTVTAIGDAVNIASRLENLTKEFLCQLIVSEDAAARAGADLTGFQRREIEVRGRRMKMAIRVVPLATHLPAASGT